MKIVDIKSRQIFNSLGNPSVEVTVSLDNGINASASSANGYYRSSKEAFEIFDKNISNFNGLGVKSAIANIENKIKPALLGRNVSNQTNIDQIMVDLDGTDNKRKLGANAMLPVSIAIAKCASISHNLKLYRYIGGIMGNIIPVPVLNMIEVPEKSGAGFREIMIMPVSGEKFHNAIEIGIQIFNELGRFLKNKCIDYYISPRGSFVIDILSLSDSVELLISAIEESGYKSGQDVLIAISICANKFFDQLTGRYYIESEDKAVSSDEMIDMYYDLIKSYPIFSIEDPMSEFDVDGFVNMYKALGKYVQIVGGDIFATNPYILQNFLPDKISNAILIKPSQIGTVSEVLMTIDIAKNFGHNVILSHRSYETEDVFLSHICVGSRSNQIKAGSIFHGRAIKYNEILRIEEDLQEEGVFAGSVILQQFAKFRNNLIANI